VSSRGCRDTIVSTNVVSPNGLHAAADPAAHRSHMRKVRSYEVETHWYQNYATSSKCRIPSCLAACSHGDEMLIVLEDLDVAGYDQRRTNVKDYEIRACLSWLAHFHAHFLGVAPQGLWPIGTYWHLKTRPDELEAMDDARLKAAAGAVDEVLNSCRFLTIVHGDAKLANFCFSSDGRDVAAVDFQYVGGGCGMKDVAYFLGSCLEEREGDKKVPGLLDHYFSELKHVVSAQVDFAALEKEWREMFAFAWTDFRRFLLGWMPGHWKIDRYNKRLADEVLLKLKL
uniref:Protein kinase-like domain containing n=1 Tax=Hippocampus comes TaxID=109280 RepID=A0A3Q2XIL2_HIPCM